MQLKIFFTNKSHAVVNLPNPECDAARLITDRLKECNGGMVVFGNCIASVSQITNILLIMDDKKKQRHAKNGIIKD